MLPAVEPMRDWLLRRACLSLLVVALFAGAGSALAQQAPDRILPLEVTVNGSKSGTWLLLERSGMLYAPRDAFEEWRVMIHGDAAGVNYRGTSYLPLSAIPGFSAKINFGNQSIDLDFSPQVFAATRLTTELVKKPLLSPVLPSFFVNYDLNYAVTPSRDSPLTKDLGLLAEVGFSNSWGVITSSYTARNLTGQSTPGSARGLIRLETSFTRDLPDRHQTFRLGDSSTRPGMWGRSVYYGGVQWGSNFALTPGFISQPTPTLSGVSAAPSTVELYVNDVLRQVSTVPTGPFAINNFPGLTGGGEARLVVRDLLGRETIITQPFFTNSQLLAQGLDDWSLEAGRLRLDLGSASNRYGPGFVGGTWRHGFTNETTGGGRIEATQRNQLAGAGLIVGLPFQMLGKAAAGLTQAQALGRGHQWLLGLERQGVRTGAYLQAQRSSLGYRQLGDDFAIAPTKLQVAGNFSYSTDRLGTFGMGFARISRYDGERISTVSANYSIRVGERSNLTVTASRAVSGSSGTSVGVTLTVQLEKNRLFSASAGKRDGQHDFFVSASQSPGFDGEFAWRTLAGRQHGENRAEGGLYYDGRYGRLSGDLSAAPSVTALRLGAEGGIVFADSRLFATRKVDESFAVAEVAGYGNVGIGLGSNVLTHTDAQGIALIPRLSPYQNNSIRIDPRELPLSAEIDSIEQIAVPAWRSAVKVVFPVRSGRGALVKILFDDGEPAPAGAVVRIDKEKEEFYVARRGEAFITGLQPINRVWLTWNGQQCRFDVNLPTESPDEIARLGPLLCKGVPR